jgi:hypothetical protein
MGIAVKALNSDFSSHNIGNLSLSIEFELVIGKTSGTLTMKSNAERIYYTIDGSTPTKDSLLYSEPLNITVSAYIRAIGISGNSQSLIADKVCVVPSDWTWYVDTDCYDAAEKTFVFKHKEDGSIKYLDAKNIEITNGDNGSLLVDSTVHIKDQNLGVGTSDFTYIQLVGKLNGISVVGLTDSYYYGSNANGRGGVRFSMMDDNTERSLECAINLSSGWMTRKVKVSKDQPVLASGTRKDGTLTLRVLNDIVYTEDNFNYNFSGAASYPKIELCSVSNGEEWYASILYLRCLSEDELKMINAYLIHKYNITPYTINE